MAKLKHIALSVKDPEATAQFYERAFDLHRVGKTDSALAEGIYLSDGVINIALLLYKTDEMAGYVEGEDERGKDFEGIHHMGFMVDSLEDTEKKIENAGGKYLMGRPNGSAEPNTFYEMKFRDPQGVIVDVTHLGWSTNKEK
jgi:catechol 2,3-dioxygenase-like lactoylglutathione lyase family enzyme